MVIKVSLAVCGDEGITSCVVLKVSLAECGDEGVTSCVW